TRKHARHTQSTTTRLRLRRGLRPEPVQTVIVGNRANTAEPHCGRTADDKWRCLTACLV
ncbi:hypothetical protein E4U41_006625, partial [Claviceps citrina]